ncbi:MAG: hypothetical protein WA859_16710 [Candidatus Sulfotelmatobacter sp.]
MPKISVVAVLLCCLSSLGYSQIPNGNIFGGYSYLNSNGLASSNGSGLSGLEGSAEGKVLPFISLVGDVSWHQGSSGFPEPVQPCVPLPRSLPGGCIGSFGSGPPSEISEYTFLFGPRASFRIKNFRPFVHALFGGAHVNESGFGVPGSSTVFADAIGGGLDYQFTRRFGWRIQVDALQTRFFGTSQTNARISTGPVVRF